MTVTISAARLAAALTPPQGVAYRDLADQIRLLIVDGRIAAGARLPSERELAAATGLSRTTTARAYAELRDAGLLRSRRGSGSVVRLPFAESSASSLIESPDGRRRDRHDLRGPVAPAGLGRAFEAAIARLPGLLSTTGYLPDGLPALRELLAAAVRGARPAHVARPDRRDERRPRRDLPDRSGVRRAGRPRPGRVGELPVRPRGVRRRPGRGSPRSRSSPTARGTSRRPSPCWRPAAIAPRT